MVRGIQDWIESPDSGYAQFEQMVREKVMDVERQAHALGLQSLDVDCEELDVGGVRYVRGEVSQIPYIGLAGEFSVERHLYRPADGPGRVVQRVRHLEMIRELDRAA